MFLIQINIQCVFNIQICSETFKFNPWHVNKNMARVKKCIVSRLPDFWSKYDIFLWLLLLLRSLISNRIPYCYSLGFFFFFFFSNQYCACNFSKMACPIFMKILDFTSYNLNAIANFFGCVRHFRFLNIANEFQRGRFSMSVLIHAVL